MTHPTARFLRQWPNTHLKGGFGISRVDIPCSGITWYHLISPGYHLISPDVISQEILDMASKQMDLILVGGFSPPIWNIWSSNWIISPILAVKIHNMWNHHPEFICLFELLLSTTKCEKKWACEAAASQNPWKKSTKLSTLINDLCVFNSKRHPFHPKLSTHQPPKKNLSNGHPFHQPPVHDLSLQHPGSHTRYSALCLASALVGAVGSSKAVWKQVFSSCRPSWPQPFFQDRTADGV